MAAGLLAVLDKDSCGCGETQECVDTWCSIRDEYRDDIVAAIAAAMGLDHD